MNVGILITNPNHHLEITYPIALKLLEQGHKPYYISLCEMRRMSTPMEFFIQRNLEVLRLKKLPDTIKPNTGSKSLGGSNSLLRAVLREVYWRVKLKKFIAQAVSRADRIILMNDAAFPGDRIARYLKTRHIQFDLIQEGIRFPLPNEAKSKYGSGGATRIFSWGDRSAVHFESVKSTQTKVLALGSPRIDKQYEFFNKSTLRSNSQPVLGLFSNPIDDQGFCDFATKIQIVKRFFERYGTLINTNGVKVLIKCHPREAHQDYLTALEPLIDRIEIAKSGIEEAILSVDAGLIMASTVGLELLLAGKRVIQLNIPGHGYVFDYVSGQAAIGEEELDEAHFLTLFDKSQHIEMEYLSSHFANLGHSVDAIATELVG